MEFLLDKALNVLKKGGVIIFPTDTVWGIGASLKSQRGIKKLYQIKRREKGKPTAVLVADKKMAQNLGIINKEAEKLIDKYWPGGLTIVVKGKSGGTIGLRQPNQPLILKLIKNLGTGLVAASANFSGRPAPKTRKELDPQLVKLADLVLSGEARGGPASAVVDTTVKPFVIIRKSPLFTS